LERLRHRFSQYSSRSGFHTSVHNFFELVSFINNTLLADFIKSCDDYFKCLAFKKLLQVAMNDDGIDVSLKPIFLLKPKAGDAGCQKENQDLKKSHIQVDLFM